MKNIPCDIVLLPKVALAKKAIEASVKLNQLGGLFVLKDGKTYPHISMYMFQLGLDDVGRVEEALLQISQVSSEVMGKVTKYDLGQGAAAGYVDAEYEATQDLCSLQDAIVRAINPIRSGMREKDQVKMEDAVGAKLENLKEYGYPAVGELFRPHMTLTRLSKYRIESLNVVPCVDDFNGVFDRIGLFEMGDNGTCIRKILEIPLASD